ncbi:MAG TPA: hypothetical protein IAC64_10125 [Candidatus Caccomorpha excrementavium]|nr:hypothetical protein [Candidatus Caccomorpha excrementavium]
MTQQEKQTWFTKFNNQLHILGRITLGIGVILMLAAPFVIGVLLDAAPNLNGFLKGIARVAVIYVPVGIVEFLVYAPMLGAGGSYLSFITGNVTNLKIPCAMNARDIAKTEVGTPENEIISTLSVATSSLVTMLVLFVGVLLLVPLRPILENPVLTPAFDTVVPALFGALGLKYFSKAPKIAIVPLASMTLLCVLVPAAIPQTSILLIPAGGLALGIGYLLYKKGRI